MGRGEIHPDEDVRLVLDAARGSEVAFEQLYKKYFVVIRGCLANRNGHGLSVDDLTQEVFLRAWKRREHFRAQSSVMTYLIGIARNVLNEDNATYRRKASSQITPSHMRSSPPSDGTIGSSVEIEGQEIAETIRRTLVQLSPKQRQALEMVYIDELSITEAAKEANCPFETLRSRLRLGKKALRCALKRVLKITEP
jgi:RNA polymerase sigma-70 factor (ECF subfamily)